MQAKLSLFACAPVQKAGFLISAEIVEGAAYDEIAFACTVASCMKVVFVRANIVVASRPADIVGGIYDRALSGIVRSHRDIGTRREFGL